MVFLSSQPSKGFYMTASLFKFSFFYVNYSGIEFLISENIKQQLNHMCILSVDKNMKISLFWRPFCIYSFCFKLSKDDNSTPNWI